MSSKLVRPLIWTMMMQEKKSVLVFCGTRAKVESTAAQLAELVHDGIFAVPERTDFTSSADSASQSKRANILSDLPKDVPERLRRCLAAGVAYHHAGAFATPDGSRLGRWCE
jgi:replicative superfamily II helicase